MRLVQEGGKLLPPSLVSRGYQTKLWNTCMLLIWALPVYFHFPRLINGLSWRDPRAPITASRSDLFQSAKFVAFSALSTHPSPSFSSSPPLISLSSGPSPTPPLGCLPIKHHLSGAALSWLVGKKVWLKWSANTKLGKTSWVSGVSPSRPQLFSSSTSQRRRHC